MKFGGADLLVTWNAVDVTQYIMSIADIDIEVMAQDSKSFGDRWNEKLHNGSLNINDFDMGGLDDDAASGPKALWGLIPSAPGPSDTPGTLVITCGTPSGSPAYAISGSFFATKYKRKLSRDGIHEFTVTMVKGPGAVTVT